ncbi:MAG: glycosyltransferase family 4 protein [Beijerinckiaceae bacterium]
MASAPEPRRGDGSFLFVGRLSPEKGARLFCEAARRTGVAARLVGDGPLRQELQRDFPEHAFAGWRNVAEVAGEMRGAQALVFPSALYEGQPLAVQEALAHGCPVIASDAGSGAEAIAHGRNGLHFRSGDADSLAAAMSVLMDSTRANDMARAAHEDYWRAPLTLERHLDGVWAVYRAAMIEPAGMTAAAG